MLIIGTIYRLLQQMFSNPHLGEGGGLIAVVVFSRLCNIESDFSLIFGGLFLTLISLAIVLRVIQAERIHLPLDVFRFR